MTLIFCVDDNFGLMFNKRRQSRDSAVLKDIKNCFAGEKICISPYSERLFSESKIDYTVCKNFNNQDAIYFVEDKYNPEILKIADSVILYHWGKGYPADIKFDMALLSADFTLVQSSSFKGTSHNEIKKERYIR